MSLLDNSVYTEQCVYILKITVAKYYGILRTNVKQCHAPILRHCQYQ